VTGFLSTGSKLVTKKLFSMHLLNVKQYVH